jgi:hypothetical protein
MEHPAFQNQDIIKFLTTEELRILSNLKEMRRSLAAIINHFEQEEGAIFVAVRARLPKEGENHVD